MEAARTNCGASFHNLYGPMCGNKTDADSHALQFTSQVYGVVK